jgi:hypothetical protein
MTSEVVNAGIIAIVEDARSERHDG